MQLRVLASSLIIAGCAFGATTAHADECEFDSVIGTQRIYLNNYTARFLGYPMEQMPDRDGSLPCEVGALISSSPAYIYRQVSEPQQYFVDEFKYSWHSPGYSTNRSGERAVIRRYEFIGTSFSQNPRNLSFEVVADGQGSYVIVTQTLVTTNVSGLSRKFPVGTTFRVRTSPNAGNSTKVSIEAMHADEGFEPIEIGVPEIVKVSGIKQGNLQLLSTHGGGWVTVINY